MISPRRSRHRSRSRKPQFKDAHVVNLQLDELRQAAFTFAVAFKPWATLKTVILVFDDADQVPIMMPPAGMVADSIRVAPPADFDPTPLQTRVIQFLVGGAKSSKQLRDKIGGHLYDSPGGIHELIELGIVEKKFSKRRLTEIGQSIAEEIGDEGDERSAVPPLSLKQKRILVALLPGPKKGDALAAACELSNRSSLHSGRGLKQLMEWGLVLNDEADGYTLTESGQSLAEEVGDKESGT